MGQLDIFLEIWEERPHVSEIKESGMILQLVNQNHLLWINQFFHILPKSIYGKAKLSKENIILTTYDQHHRWTTNVGSLKKLEEWQWVFEKYEELKQKYHQGYFDNL